MESFNTLYEAQLLIADWRLEYNYYRLGSDREIQVEVGAAQALATWSPLTKGV
jgi:hypothetical protein